MHEPTATLEKQRGPADTRTVDYRYPVTPRDLTMKFAYASGARPLDGYTIKRGIGIGGFGEVYFAISDAGKEVALKRIQRNLDVELRGVSQCLNLKHANLIALWDIRHDEHGEGWVVMEYVSGESLKDIIDRNPNGMREAEFQKWFEGIAAGVAYLHDHGIVHRDLKPGNIFEDEDVVKIGDYGLSKFISCSRRSGQTESVGTFHYMAPEIGKGVYGKEIDIYALGIILYEMLTGRVPFDGESSQEIIMKHLTADPDLRDVPDPYRRVIAKALAKDPDLRYSGVREMLADLPFGETRRQSTSPEQQTSRAVPPVRPLVIKDEQPNETLYISDEGGDEIVMGDVKEIVTAEPVDERLKQPRHFPPQHGRVPPARVQSSGDEPIAAAVKGGWGRMSTWWNGGGLSAPVKIVLLVFGALFLLLNWEWLIPVCIVLGLLYIVYYTVRSIVLWAGNRRGISKDELREVLNRRAASDRLAELTGSLLMSAAVAAVLSVVTMVIGLALPSVSFPMDSAATWSFFAWLTLSVMSCTWVILGLGKMWEGRKGDGVMRRFVMLVAGLAVGALAFGLHNALLVEQAQLLRADAVWFPWSEIGFPESLQASGDELALPAYLAYFGGLLVILRWWRQSDPLRNTRLSVFAVLACVLWALIFPFAQPWGVMLAASISIAVQLSAPWMNSKERSLVRQQLQEA